MIACTSAPTDRDAIVRLMCEALGIPEGAVAAGEAFQRWKYWTPHPFVAGSRSHILRNEEAIVAHGCVWPVQIETTSGSFSAFHLIDWVAKRDVPGAGMRVLRTCGAGQAAIFSIGGSAMTRKILPAFGFKQHNQVGYFHRPIRPFQPALSESPADWKMPARVARNLAWYWPPSRRVPAGWQVKEVGPEQIPASLWPRPSEGEAVAGRSAELLSHIRACPLVSRSVCALLSRGSGAPVAYMLLIQIGHQVRLADYGPNGLNAEESRALGLCAQALAGSAFPEATSIFAATTEPAGREGFLQAGLRFSGDEAIKVLRTDKALPPIERFRLTLLDSDALCL